MGNSKGGCFGGATMVTPNGYGRDFYGGECVCSTGQFRHAERWKLQGYATGVAHGVVVTLMATVGEAFTTASGSRGERMQSWMLAVVKHDGQFRFPNRLVSGHTYFITIKSVTVGGERVPESKCALVKGFRGAASGADITNLRVHCTGKGVARASATASAQASSAAAQVAKMHKAFHAMRIRAPDCQDSPLLLRESSAMTPADRKAVRQDTKLPCKRGFTIHPEHHSGDGMYITEMRGKPCISYQVRADHPVHVCFVQDAIWYQLGATAAMRDLNICPCQGVTDCKHTHSGLDPSATYLLFVRESKDRSKLHFHSYADFQHSFTPTHIHVWAETCTDAKNKKAMIVGGGVLLGAILLIKAVKGKGSSTPGYARIADQELARRGRK